MGTLLPTNFEPYSIKQSISDRHFLFFHPGARVTQCGDEELKDISCPIGSTIFIGREFYGRRQEQQLCDQDDEHKITSTSSPTSSPTSSSTSSSSSSSSSISISSSSSSSISISYESTKSDAQLGKNSILEPFV